MTPRTKRILIWTGIAAGIAIVLLLLFILLNPDRQTPTENITPTTTEPTENLGQPEIKNGQLPVSGPPVKIPDNGSQDPTQLFIRQRAEDFVERFRSFSNQNNNQHIEDVFPLATESMQTWMLSQAGDFESDYEGISTRVITTSLVSADDATAVVTFGAQETRQRVGEDEIVYRSGRVELVRFRNTWLVDGLYFDE